MDNEMTVMDRLGIIPAQREGKYNDLSSEVDLPDVVHAVRRYMQACRRMLAPGLWHKICGPLSASFEVTDAMGRVLNRLPGVNDYIRIDLPGPGPAAGQGYDWVMVDAIRRNATDQANEELCAMTLRPVSAPNGGQNEPAHFFRGGATSTFIVRRRGRHVAASYHGRNELPNTATDKATDNVRNAIIASGAMAGLSEMQWQALIDAFLEE